MDYTFTTADRIFAIPLRFTAGHVCTEAQARVLNQIVAENMGNNFRAKVKEAGDDEEKLRTLAKEIYEAAAVYEFNNRTRTSREPTDPVEAELLRLSKVAVTAAIKNQLGLTAKAFIEKYGQEVYDAQIDKAMANEDRQKLAKKRVADAKKAAPAEGEFQFPT